MPYDISTTQTRPDRWTVAVYGTLRAGERNHDVLRTSHFVGPGRTVEGFAMVDCFDGSFPAIIRGETAPTVAVEVYEVDADTLADLDRLESVPSHYQRTVAKVKLGFGSPAWTVENATVRDCVLYTQPSIDGRPVIASGDWVKDQAAKRAATG